MEIKPEEVIIISDPRPPLLLVAVPRVLFHRLFRAFAPPWKIDWMATAEDVVARFLIGLLLGAALCVPLFAFIFWPGRRRRHRSNPAQSVFDTLGAPHWIGWVFVATALGPALFRAVTTRAAVSFDDSDANQA